VISYADARANGLTHYFNGIECVNGHLSLRRVGNRQCLQCDKQRALEKNKEQYRKHKEKRLQKAREYREKNREKIIFQSAAYSKMRRQSDPLYAMRNRLGVRVREALQAKGVKKNSRTMKMLGCDILEFKAHIEKQFLPGMTWDNSGSWHVDHIVPCSSAGDESELIKLFHYTNLRPIWAKDNLAKSSKNTFLI
jgi:hypothetical protein